MPKYTYKEAEVDVKWSGEVDLYFQGKLLMKTDGNGLLQLAYPMIEARANAPATPEPVTPVDGDPSQPPT